MSEQTLVPLSEREPTLESKATPERQAEAMKLGWISPERFRGDPERYIDAEEYIERGEIVTPIVKARNAELRAKLTGLETESSQTKEALAAALTKIDEIEVRHSVDRQKAVALAKAETKAELAAASAAGDHEGMADLTERMVELNAEEAVEVKPVEKVPAKPVAFQVPPELAAWNIRNAWFGPDKRKTAMAVVIAGELRDAGETVLGEAFFDLVTVEVERAFGAPAPVPNKVEGARNGTDGDARVGARGGTAYSDLPADAKAVCAADVKRFVGEGKKYKTAEEWQADYARIYFEE